MSKAVFWRTEYRMHLVPDSGCNSIWAGHITITVYNYSLFLITFCKGYCPATYVYRNKNQCYYTFSIYTSLTLILSASTGLYKNLKIWNISHIQNSNGKLNWSFLTTLLYQLNFVMTSQLMQARSTHQSPVTLRGDCRGLVATQRHSAAFLLVTTMYLISQLGIRADESLIIRNKIGTLVIILWNEKGFL